MGVRRVPAAGEIKKPAFLPKDRLPEMEGNRMNLRMEYTYDTIITFLF